MNDIILISSIKPIECIKSLFFRNFLFWNLLEEFRSQIQSKIIKIGLISHNYFNANIKKNLINTYYKFIEYQLIERKQAVLIIKKSY